MISDILDIFNSKSVQIMYLCKRNLFWETWMTRSNSLSYVMTVHSSYQLYLKCVYLWFLCEIAYENKDDVTKLWNDVHNAFLYAYILIEVVCDVFVFRFCSFDMMPNRNVLGCFGRNDTWKAKTLPFCIYLTKLCENLLGQLKRLQAQSCPPWPRPSVYEQNHYSDATWAPWVSQITDNATEFSRFCSG